jgi:hypothetical protein
MVIKAINCAIVYALIAKNESAVRSFYQVNLYYCYRIIIFISYYVRVHLQTQWLTQYFLKRK